MTLDSITTTVLDFVRNNQAYAPFIVAALAFAESLAVLSILVPSTVLLLGIGALVGATGIEFWPIWAGAAVGGILGDWASYEIGRYFQDGAKRVWPLSRRPDLVEKGEAFTRKHGAWGVFIGRFFGPARAIVPLAAGIFAMDRFHFQLANVTSGLLWAFAMLAPGSTVAGWLRF